MNSDAAATNSAGGCTMIVTYFRKETTCWTRQRLTCLVAAQHSLSQKIGFWKSCVLWERAWVVGLARWSWVRKVEAYERD
ncbi:hypothetical protein DUNSADRAFT_11251 [Dunaliella salina]|uniref:Encoded protein n=1 Tax=Dunaliella salina TaxID=3046 RepID=A0ABQ7GDT3_DUNSA|nr:hypothetical protein DUNSADRAFT_11251 [Dunaliella salina]|eukprot:KAF5832764.1 hypothetical protein DUNSADRAFT_11251 [Dunaliella salina]